jgi:hypothetical protein
MQQPGGSVGHVDGHLEAVDAMDIGSGGRIDATRAYGNLRIAEGKTPCGRGSHAAQPGFQHRRL